MERSSLLGVVIASMLAASCAFENTTTLLAPTAPSGNAAGGTASTGTSSSTSSGTAATTPHRLCRAGSSSIVGLPVSNCADFEVADH